MTQLPNPAYPRYLQPGQRATRYPLGPGPDLIGVILEPGDPRIWGHTPYATLEGERRSEHTLTMIALTRELPIFFAEGRGFSWIPSELLFPVK